LWEELGRQIEVFLESVTLTDVIEQRILGRAHLARPNRLAAELLGPA
jgi:Rrf2 family iron-sulfur cluster assembly transcriptional regulator